MMKYTLKRKHHLLKSELHFQCEQPYLHTHSLVFCWLMHSVYSLLYSL